MDIFEIFTAETFVKINLCIWRNFLPEQKCFCNNWQAHIELADVAGCIKCLLSDHSAFCTDESYCMFTTDFTIWEIRLLDKIFPSLNVIKINPCLITDTFLKAYY